MVVAVATALPLVAIAVVVVVVAVPVAAVVTIIVVTVAAAAAVAPLNAVALPLALRLARRPAVVAAVPLRPLRWTVALRHPLRKLPLRLLRRPSSSVAVLVWSTSVASSGFGIRPSFVTSGSAKPCWQIECFDKVSRVSSLGDPAFFVPTVGAS